jgi:hypothetical protein
MQEPGEYTSLIWRCGGEGYRGMEGIGNGVRTIWKHKDEIRMCTEVLRHWVMWRGCFENEANKGVSDHERGFGWYIES